MNIQHGSRVKTYLTVYVLLLVLLGLTVEVARHDLGHFDFAVTMLIASAKVILIALFFMHVREGTPLVKLVIAAGILWLGILFSLALADYWTRGWDPHSDGFKNTSQVRAE